ncbi:MAG TPA: hypothetical protein VKP88_05835 [Candidatus Paceibacterota bacterium]|nr:hypothetical protein [Candidatus Paceibacterota bacterium]
MAHDTNEFYTVFNDLIELEEALYELNSTHRYVEHFGGAHRNRQRTEDLLARLEEFRPVGATDIEMLEEVMAKIEDALEEVRDSFDAAPEADNIFVEDGVSA